MNKFLLFFFSFASFLDSNSQTVFNKAYHGTSEHVMPFVIELNNNLFFVTENLDGSNFGKGMLYKHNSNGSLIAAVNLPMLTSPFRPTSPRIGFKTLDNNLLFAGSGEICDGTPPPQTNYVAKYNENGGVVFIATYTVRVGQSPVACVQGLDSSYYSFTDSSVFKHNKTGQFVLKSSPGIKDISSALVLPNNTILVSAKINGANVLCVVSTSGTILNSVQTPKLYSKLVFYGGQKIMALGVDGSISKFSSGFSFINSGMLPSGTTITDFACKNDSVYTIRTSSVVEASYAVSDTSFTNLGSSATSTNRIKQVAIAVTSNNKVAIVSDGVSHVTNLFMFSQKHSFVSLNVIDKFSSNNFVEDIALVSVVADSIYTTNSGTSLKHVRAKAKIKNVGTKLITSFKLNCFEYPHVACGAYYYQEKFSQLNIMPGDSITVTTNRFVSGFLALPTCFYVTVPNESVDKTLADNEICNNFTVTSLKNNASVSNTVKVLPNPFDKVVFVRSEEEIKTYSVISSLGEVISKNEPHSKEAAINTEKMVRGIYFLKIESEQGTVIRKIIKE